MLQRTGVIIKKLMDDNAMLRIERNRLVEESMDAAKQHIKDKKLMKEIIARRENWPPRPAAHKESRDQRARSLYASSFCWNFASRPLAQSPTKILKFSWPIHAHM